MLKEFFQAFMDNKSTLDEMSENFSTMLKTSKEMFEETSTLMFKGGDLQKVHEFIFPADKELNKLERMIRREVVTHLVISGTQELSTMLIFMSVVKDAERIGDYIKNCFEIYQDGGILKDTAKTKELLVIRDEILPLFEQVDFVFKENKYKKTTALIKKVIPIEKKCNQFARDMVVEGCQLEDGVKLALGARYFKRILSHLLNILTAVVMPIDKLDFFDEEDVVKFKSGVENTHQESEINSEQEDK